MLPSRGTKITGHVTIAPAIIADVRNTVRAIADFKTNVEAALSSNVSEIVERILLAAIVLNASDLHIEPEEKQVKLRCRLDGVLHNVLTFEPEKYSALLSRIKLLSGLKINVTDRPQDGRFSILVDKDAIEIRASALPSEHGEALVLRVLNPKNLIDMKELGLRDDMRQLFETEFKKPHGMIIVTGPTGSGKTTTLYAILKKINKPEVKIITIEDPIEYHLEGVSQTQVTHKIEYRLEGASQTKVALKKTYDFANGLQAIVRQDPDVILVGEVRDAETAHIAIQAALTGHLVLTTLHTNDAAGTIARLKALGEKAINIAPAVNLVVAQRLVRRVCKACAQKTAVTAEELSLLKKNLAHLPKGVRLPRLDKTTKIARQKGCVACNNTGYHGRIGIFELLVMTDKVEKFLLADPSIAALRDFAIAHGMIPMHQDGLLKVLEGITTIKEVQRVTTE